MNNTEVLAVTEKFVRDRLSADTTGHDWWHTYRVRQLALLIGREENADLFVVELAALLHDISDWKFSGGDDKAGSKVADEWLRAHSVPLEIIQKICCIIQEVSYKGAGVEDVVSSVEGMVVQDADRLDAIGAIGIARAFAYGGSKNRAIYTPGEEPFYHKDFEEYKKSSSSTINHFHEKLLLIIDRMKTETGRRIASLRHEFLLEFLKRFSSEWDGNN